MKFQSTEDKLQVLLACREMSNKQTKHFLHKHMELFNGTNFNLEHHGARLQTSKKNNFQTKFHANLLEFYS